MKLTHGNGIIALIPGMSLQMGNTWGSGHFWYWWDPRKTHCRVLWTKATQSGNSTKMFYVGCCLETLLRYDLIYFWRAQESKCSMVLSILESLEAWRRLQWGLFFLSSLLCLTKDKNIHRRAFPSFWGWENSLSLVVQSGQKRLNLYWLGGHSDTFRSMNETNFARKYFLDEKARK